MGQGSSRIVMWSSKGRRRPCLDPHIECKTCHGINLRPESRVSLPRRSVYSVNASDRPQASCKSKRGYCCWTALLRAGNEWPDTVVLITRSCWSFSRDRRNEPAVHVQDSRAGVFASRTRLQLRSRQGPIRPFHPRLTSTSGFSSCTS